MAVGVVRDGPSAVIEPAGRIDARGAREFESIATGLVGERVRTIVVDFAQVDLITAAGIRVLLTLGQRLDRSGGGLALCALNERVRGVFDVAGLLPEFRIAATRPEALAQLASIGPASSPSPPPVSALTLTVVDALMADSPGPPAARPATPSALASRVVDALTRGDA